MQTAGNLLVGFKYIGGEMDLRGPKDFVFGAEESYGFLAGDHVRDKDAAVASHAAGRVGRAVEGRRARRSAPAARRTVRRHGCHSESQITVQMPGEQGMDDMKALMAGLRSQPPVAIAGMNVVRVRDYLADTVTAAGRRCKPLDGPTGDLVIFDLVAEGNYVAVRPSGTEPKVKFYMFAYDPPEPCQDLADTAAARARQVLTKIGQSQRLRAMEADLRALAGV